MGSIIFLIGYILVFIFEFFKNSSMFAVSFSFTVTGTQNTWELELGEYTLSGRGDPNKHVETRKT